MKITPKSAEEIEKARKDRMAQYLLPKGEYDFEVLTSEELTSKAGNPMFKLTISVFSEDGTRFPVTDYLVCNQEEKLFAFAHCVGIEERYNSGEMTAEDCEGRSGRVKIKTDPAKDGYDAKNAVQNYVVPKKDAAPTSIASKSADLEDDDIPF